MKGLNTGAENLNNDGTIGPDREPGFGPATFSIKVSHELNEHEVAVPSGSTFGYLKSVILQKTGLNPDTHKLLFRGKEKDDDEDLQTAGVKDGSKLLLVEDKTCNNEEPEEVKETVVVVSRGGEAVAEVRREVDKLSDQISAVQAVVDSGTKVDNKDIVYLTEMLMRQLLKLDGIEAEGEGKVQRKMEVRRVQSFVETMDVLKSRNSNPLSNGYNNVPVTTKWETFEPESQTPLPSQSPVPPVTTALPSPVPFPQSPVPPVTTPLPSPVPFPQSPVPPVTTPLPSPAPSQSPVPPVTTPSPSFAPTTQPSSAHSPVPSFVPTSMPSSTKVTQDWEHFD
ncbi:hypothetical protein ABFX02_10G012500 [Erythranthe guttata]